MKSEGGCLNLRQPLFSFSNFSRVFLINNKATVKPKFLVKLIDASPVIKLQRDDLPAGTYIVVLKKTKNNDCD